MDLVSTLISALLVAGLYAAMSYGLALIYGVLKIINLANAGFLMLGAYVTWWPVSYTHLDVYKRQTLRSRAGRAR